MLVQWKFAVVAQPLKSYGLFATPWAAARQASLSFTVCRSLLRLRTIEPVMPSNHLILCHHLLLLPSVFPSIRGFSSEWARHNLWPKYWSFTFIIGPSNDYSGLISLRIDWFDLLAVQRTLNSLLQHHSLKASILHCAPPSLWSNSQLPKHKSKQIYSVSRWAGGK